MDDADDPTTEVRSLPRFAKGRWPKPKELLILRTLAESKTAGGMFGLEIWRANERRLWRWNIYRHITNLEQLGLVFATRVLHESGLARYRYQLTPMGAALVYIARDLNIPE